MGAVTAVPGGLSSRQRSARTWHITVPSRWIGYSPSMPIVDGSYARRGEESRPAESLAQPTSLGYWMQNEAGSPPSGIVGANNPVNVSQPGYGGWPIRSEGKGYRLYSYPTPQDGIQATVAFLIPTVYPRILAALKAGVGLSSSSLASELSVYSGGGDTEIPDAWGASQGRPET
jgi:hypothetical protein